MLKNVNGAANLRAGFTIVELLIVVVVVAILAAITIVSYNGIQQRAYEVALQSDLRGAATVLELDNTQNGTYPASASAADGGRGLKSSSSTNLEYSYVALNNSYCLSATASRPGLKNFYISSQGGQITEGLCLGHAPTVATTAGDTWTARSIASNAWADVAFGGGTFVAVAGVTSTEPSVVSTSADGQAWSAPSNVGTLQAVSPRIAYSGNQFLIGFTVGRNISAISNNNGQTWQHNAPEATLSSYILSDVAYGGGVYVAVKSTPPDSTYSFVRTSTDGLNWTQTQTGVLHSGWNSVTFGNGVFVAVGNGPGSRVMTSTDGINWTARTAPQANTFTSVTYGKGLFVAVSSTGTNRVMTSPDGITWTVRNAAQANSWQAVEYGGGKFVAVSSDGTNRVMTSPDGVTWTVRSAAQANPWSAVAYGNGCFVATANSGTNRVMSSCQ